MRLSEKDLQLLEAAKAMPADVLLAAVHVQAERSIFSEAYCEELAESYLRAASVARMRRIYPETARSPRSSNLSIAGNENL